MERFYVALPYFLILAQAFGAALLARGYTIARPIRSKWALTLLAALPIPALLVSLATFAFFDVLAGLTTSCDADCCASRRSAFITMILAATALYLLGLVTAFLGYVSGKNALEARRSE
jgi:hypothetical protein